MQFGSGDHFRSPCGKQTKSKLRSVNLEFSEKLDWVNGLIAQLDRATDF